VSGFATHHMCITNVWERYLLSGRVKVWGSTMSGPHKTRVGIDGQGNGYTFWVVKRLSGALSEWVTKRDLIFHLTLDRS
jgi:hypothetical protein